MKYYIFAIEQIYGETEGTYNEYAPKVEKCNTEQEAETKYFARLSEVANAIGNTHTWMDIKIVNSKGGIVRKDHVGKYIEAAAVQNTGEAVA